MTLEKYMRFLIFKDFLEDEISRKECETATISLSTFLTKISLDNNQQ